MPTTKLVVAHRGDHSRAHENTLEAFQSAIDIGADMVEFDVRRTRDGELIVHHDEAVADQLLAHIDYSQALVLASRQNYGIPRLSETVQSLAGKIRMDVEMKEVGYEDAVLQTILACVPLENFLITSFHQECLSRIRAMNPGVRIGLLVEEMDGLSALESFRRSRADFLAPDYKMLDTVTLAQAARHNIPLLPWTVDDPSAIQNCFRQPSIFGVITNQPAEALRLRASAG
jgi:glycerophosphoryl diester phosphodiesterase